MALPWTVTSAWEKSGVERQEGGGPSPIPFSSSCTDEFLSPGVEGSAREGRQRSAFTKYVNKVTSMHTAGKSPNSANLR